MRRTIHKFVVEPSSPWVQMNSGAQVLSAGAQGDEIVLWAIVDPDLPLEPHLVAVFGTGHDCFERPGNFVGTVQLSGALVFHVFMTGGRA